MRVAVVGLRAGTDRAANRDAAVRAVHDAAADGARLVVLPEYASAFVPTGVGPDAAEPLDGPFVRALADAARAAGVHVLAGTVAPGRTPDRAVNAVAALDPSGQVAGVYRKVHLYDAYGQRESDRFEAGDPAAPPLVLDVDDLRVGVMTCYDLRFPESARRLVDAGATALAVPAAWAAGEHKADHWRTLLRARAIESCAWVLAAAQQGPGVTGASLVVDPVGVVVAEQPGAPGDGTVGPVLADCPGALVDEVRRRNPVLDNRRYVVVPR